MFNSPTTEVKSTSEHNHPAEATRADTLRTVEQIRSQATDTAEAPAAIQQRVLAGAAADVAPYLPSANALHQVIQRKRRAELPIEPDGLHAIDIPEELRTTINGDDFYIIDTIEDDDMDDAQRIIAFTTNANLRHLHAAAMWFVDGTFKTCPRLFSQLFTINADVMGEVFPLVFALLPGKTEEIYHILFQKLTSYASNELGIQLSPRYVMMDFELAVIKASARVFPDSRGKGCLFHFGQSVYRRVVAEGHKQLYDTSEDYSLSVRMLIALAFIPADRIVDVYNILKPTLPDECESLCEYLEDTYILGRVMARPVRGRPPAQPRRNPPRFPPSLWSVHELFTEQLARTNNNIEAWHRRFETIVIRYHLGIYVTIKEFQKEQHHTDTQVSQLLAGRQPQAPRKKIRDREQRIQRIFDHYEERNPLEFIRGIAHNYTL